MIVIASHRVSKQKIIYKKKNEISNTKVKFSFFFLIRIAHFEAQMVQRGYIFLEVHNGLFQHESFQNTRIGHMSCVLPWKSRIVDLEV